MNDLKQLAGQAVEIGGRLGADEIEAYIQSTEETTIRTYRQELELFNEATGMGIGIRVFNNKKEGYAYRTDLEGKSVDEIVKEALDNAAVSQSDEFAGLPEKRAGTTKAQDLKIFSSRFDSVATAEKIDFALDLEKKALSYDKRIKVCEDAVYADEKEHVCIANSSGFAGEYRRTRCYSYISVLAEEESSVQNGFAIRCGQYLGDLELEEAAEEASRKAVVLLGAKPIRSQRMTIVFDPFSFVQVLMSITSALSAESVQKGRSFLADQLDQTIASSKVTLTDDGQMIGGLGTRPFDDEGVETLKTSIIERGQLKSFLYNTYAAKKEKRRSTGNASRPSFSSPPHIGPTNLYMKPGRLGQEKIIGNINKGLFVHSVQGLHAGVNPVTGQFSVGASGLMIEKGQLTQPVREVTIASTLNDLLMNIEEVGSDLTYVSMGVNIGAPSVAVDNMMVSGR